MSSLDSRLLTTQRLTLSLAESGVLELGLVECAGLNVDTKAPFAVYLSFLHAMAWLTLTLTLCAVGPGDPLYGTTALPLAGGVGARGAEYYLLYL